MSAESSLGRPRAVDHDAPHVVSPLLEPEEAAASVHAQPLQDLEQLGTSRRVARRV